MNSNMSTTVGGTNIMSLLSLTAMAVTFGNFNASSVETPQYRGGGRDVVVADTTSPTRQELAPVATSPAFTLERLPRDFAKSTYSPWGSAEKALQLWEENLPVFRVNGDAPSRAESIAQIFEIPTDQVSPALVDIVDLAKYAGAPLPTIEFIDDFVTVDFDDSGQLISILIDNEAHHLSVVAGAKELRATWISSDQTALQDFHSHLWLELQGMRVSARSV